MTPLTYAGLPACSCLVTWLPAFEDELRETGVIDEPLHIAQLIGGATASAKTHSTGGAADLWEHDWQISKVARQMGAVAWPRTTGSFADNKHTHLVLIGCTHAHPQAKAQIVEAYAGGDGLLGDLPDAAELHSYLWPRRTWREGIAWHRAQQLRRERLVKLAKARRRRAKWKRWLKKNRIFIDNLKEKL